MSTQPESAEMPTVTQACIVDAFGYSSDDSLLHFDGRRMQPVVDAMFTSMQSAAAAQNPELADAMSRPLCGGCVLATLSLLVDKILDKSEPALSIEERGAWRASLIDELRRDTAAERFGLRPVLAARS